MGHQRTSAIAAILLAFTGGPAFATTWTVDFGTATGTTSWTSGTTAGFLPALPATGGSQFVRIGNGGGSFTLANPGDATLGSGAELTITAPTSTSVNKFSVYDYTTTSSLYSLSFSTIVSGNSGEFDVFIGNGASFSNGTAFTSADTAAGLQFILGASSITTNYRTSTTWSSTNLTTSGITKDSVLDVTVYGNNGSTSTSYYVAGTTYTLSSRTIDVWLGGSKISSSALSSGNLTAGSVVDSFMFYGQNSTGNVGTMRLDNLVYADALPAAPPAGNYWAPVAGGGGSGTWAALATNWAATASVLGSGTQAASGALVFGDAAGTVTVSGSVTAPAGMTLATTGYQFTGGTIGLTGTSPSVNTITVNAGVSGMIGSMLGGSAGMTKAGTGILTLSGNNTYSGATTVSAGGLKVNGVLGSGSLSVAAAAWLMGTGTINGPVTISGTLTPGASPGVITLGSLTLTPTSSTVIEIASAGTRGTAYDGVSILDPSGLTYGGTMSIAFGGSAIANDTTFDIFSFTGSPSGSLAAVESTGFYAGTWSPLGSGTFQLVSGTQTLTFSQTTGDVIVVPEPAAIALAAGLGGAGVVLLRRRRQA